MLEVNDTVTIIPTEELTALRLNDLCGRTGLITEVVYAIPGKVIGYMVFLSDGPYKEEFVWFIPENSVCYVQ